MNDKGIIAIWMEKMFGRSWRTSLFGLLAVLPQVANLVQTYAANINAPKWAMDTMTLVFGVITVFNMKDKAVTGIDVIPSTGKAGPSESSLIARSAAATPADPTKRFKEGKYEKI